MQSIGLMEKNRKKDFNFLKEQKQIHRISMMTMSVLKEKKQQPNVCTKITILPLLYTLINIRMARLRIAKWSLWEENLSILYVNRYYAKIGLAAKPIVQLLIK